MIKFTSLSWKTAGHISVKSMAEQLGISRERIGSIIHEDFDMRKLSAQWVPKCLNADKKRRRCQSSEQLLEFSRRDPNNFLSRRVWRPWTKPGYITIIGRQSNNRWSGGIAAHPAQTKKFRVQKSAVKSSRFRFFGIKKASSPLIIFQWAKLSTRSITHLCWCNRRTF